ncbi:MAG: hypothetical protein ACK4MV_19800 [Beijerinckiaceae bacterium]
MRNAAKWTAAGAFIVLGGVAQAQSGLPNTLNMTCAQAQALVQKSGAIVLATGPNLYERYVLNRSYCNPDQQVQPSWVRSADNPQCYIYNRCVDTSFPLR